MFCDPPQRLILDCNISTICMNHALERRSADRWRIVLVVIIPTYPFDGPRDLHFRAVHNRERVDVHWLLTVHSK